MKMSDALQINGSCTTENIRFTFVISYAIVLSVLFLFIHLTSSAALFIVGVAFLFLSVFFFSEKEHFLIIACLIQNLFMFKQPDYQTAFLCYYITILSLKKLFNQFSFTKINFFLIAHFFVCLITCFYYEDSKLFIYTTKFILNFWFILSFSEVFQKKEIPLALKAYIIGCILAIAIGAIYSINKGILFIYPFTGIGCDRNYFTAAISPVLSCVIVLFMEQSFKFNRYIILIITTLFYFLCLILAASRTAIMSLLFPCSLLISYILLKRISFDILKKFSAFAIVFLFAALFMYVQYGDSIDYLIDRFNNDNFQSGNGRFDLWAYYLKKTTSQFTTLFIGHGIEYDLNMLAEHNLIIQGFYQTGLLGVATYIILFVYSILSFFKKYRTNFLMSYVVVFSFFFCYLSVNSYHSDQLSVLFVLSLLIVRYFHNQNIKYEIHHKNL